MRRVAAIRRRILQLIRSEVIVVDVLMPFKFKRVAPRTLNTAR